MIKAALNWAAFVLSSLCPSTAPTMSPLMSAIFTLELGQHLICCERTPKEDRCSFTGTGDHLGVGAVAFGANVDTCGVTAVRAGFCERRNASAAHYA